MAVSQKNGMSMLLAICVMSRIVQLGKPTPFTIGNLAQFESASKNEVTKEKGE
jgi:hypothetical protein